MKFYKYFGPASLSIDSVLIEKKVFYSSPESFNDPFECRPHVKLATQEEISSLLSRSDLTPHNRKAFESFNFEANEEMRSNQEKEIRKIFGNYGIFCASKTHSNILMWSHYSQDHTGLCFEFDVNLGRESPATKLRYDNDFGGCADVIYSDDYYIFDIFQDLHEGLDAIRLPKEKREAYFNEANYRRLIKPLLSKSKGWQYEKEIRFIRSPEKGGSGLVALSPEKLTGIILGARARATFKKKISILSNAWETSLVIKKAILSNSSYAIEIQDET